MSITACVICSHEANIRINGTSHCNKCFTKRFLNRIAKHFSGIPRNSSIIVYIDGTQASLVVAHAISVMSTRLMHKFRVLCRECERYKHFFQSVGFVECRNKDEVTHERFDYCPLCMANKNGLDPIPKEILETARNCEADVVASQLCAELESVMAFCSVCSGLGVSKCLDKEMSRVEDVKILNVLHGVRSKEIKYYWYLNMGTIPEGTKEGMTKLEKIILRFISKVEMKNELVLFNVLNTIRKISL